MARKSLLVVLVLIAALASACSCRLEQPAPEPEQAVWPLTGLRAPDDADVRQRVVSVKIDNLARARPQAGLADADIVYEVVAEGGITRFHALYHSKAAERVGPVRSARPPDIRIVRQFGSVLVYSGANQVVLRLIASSGIDALNETAGGRALERSGQRPAPHNLYASIPIAREVAAERGFEAEADVQPLLFGETSVEGSSATEVEVSFNASNRIVWRWNAEDRRFERELNGQPHADEGSSDPYRAANVVLLFAGIIEGDRPGTADLQLDTSGQAIVFRDGRRYDAEWEASAEGPPRFTSVEGGELTLAPGPTWFEVFPPDERSRFE